MLGVAAAIIGFILFYFDQTKVYVALSYKWSIFWLLLGGLTWAIYSSCQKVLTKKISLHYSPQFINLAVFFISAIALLPLAKLNELSSLSLKNILIFLFLGANTFLAYGSLSEALKRAPASQVSLIIAVNPIVTILILQILNFFDLSPIATEGITFVGVIGALFVVTGLVLTVSKKKKR